MTPYYKKTILIGYYERDFSIFRIYYSFDYQNERGIVNALESFIKNYSSYPESEELPLKSFRIIDMNHMTRTHAPLSIFKFLEKTRHEAEKRKPSIRCPKIHPCTKKVGMGMLPMGVYHAEF